MVKPVYTPITRADVAKEPLCCEEAQFYLMRHRNAVEAWNRCFHPGFLCWFLDYVRTRIPDFDATLTPRGLSFTRTPWRMILYRDFFHYEMGFPGWLIHLILGILPKSRRLSLWVFWLVVGYFDGQRNQKNPAHWWIYTATDLKTLYQGVRGFLSETA